MTVAPLDGVAPGLDDAPLLVPKVILLHGVQVPELGAVAEDDDHPVLNHSGRVSRAVNLAAEGAQASTCLRISRLHSLVSRFRLQSSLLTWPGLMTPPYMKSLLLWITTEWPYLSLGGRPPSLLT